MATKYTAQATTKGEYRTKSIIICALLMIFALIAFGLMIYNIIKLRFGFAVGYLIGMLFAIMFIFIRMNMAFPARISADRKILALTSWTNRLLPYKTECTIPFVREFIPAKTRTIRIETAKIRDIYIGTKSYISRSVSGDGFINEISSLAPENDLKKISKSDLLCVRDVNDIYYIMNLENFDFKATCKIITSILRANNMIEFHTGSKKYKIYVG